MRHVFFLLMTLSLSFGSIATAQETDFFWSDKDLGMGAVNEALVVGSKTVGDTGSLFLYYSTNGPAGADLDTGAFLDIATSQPGVIRFTNAETFDFPLSLGSPPLVFDNRWPRPGFCTEDGFGQTGTVSDDFINELGAFTVALSGGIRADAKMLDQGYDPVAGAFLFGRVDYEVIGVGCVQIHVGRGQAGIACCVPLSGPETDGGFLDVAFGSALVPVPIPPPIGVPPLNPFPPRSLELGDVNLDNEVNFLDISPFVETLLADDYVIEADTDCDGVVSFLDIRPFINLLLGIEGFEVIDPSEESTVPQPDLLGDANNDGFIDLLDVGCYRNLGRDCGFLNPNADIDGNGTVDFLDLCGFDSILLDQN